MKRLLTVLALALVLGVGVGLGLLDTRTETAKEPLRAVRRLASPASVAAGGRTAVRVDARRPSEPPPRKEGSTEEWQTDFIEIDGVKLTVADVLHNFRDDIRVLSADERRLVFSLYRQLAGKEKDGKELLRLARLALASGNRALRSYGVRAIGVASAPGGALDPLDAISDLTTVLSDPESQISDQALFQITDDFVSLATDAEKAQVAEAYLKNTDNKKLITFLNGQLGMLSDTALQVRTLANVIESGSRAAAGAEYSYSMVTGERYSKEGAEQWLNAHSRVLPRQ